MAEQTEKIYDSAPPEINDDLWLEQGKLLFQGSLDAVNRAAQALLTVLGLLQGVYLAILGFGLQNATLPSAALPQAALPLLAWLAALYLCLTTLMTRRYQINLRSPSEIRQVSGSILDSKQFRLHLAFWLIALGLVATLPILADCFRTTPT